MQAGSKPARRARSWSCNTALRWRSWSREGAFRIALAATLAACGVVPLPVGPSDPLAPPPLRAQNVEFQTLATRWFGIWSTDPKVVADAEALFAPDADAIFFDGFMPVEGEFGPPGWRAETRRASILRFDSFNVTPSEGVWLRRNGDRAIASIPFRVKLSAGGRSGETDGCTTLMFEHRGGAWKIVHEHTSFGLLEEWLGGIDADLEPPPQDHIHPGDVEFQLLIDTYLAELEASRSADLLRSNAPGRFFAPDLEVLVFEPTSRRPLLGWASVAAHRDAIDLRIDLTNKQSRKDVRVWKNGDWAWATFTFTTRATRRDGDRFELVGRQTDVFQRIDGKWLIVHEHASVPYGPEGTPGVRSEIVLARSDPRTTRSMPRLPVIVPASSAIDAITDRQEFQSLLFDYAADWSTTDGALDWPRMLRLYASGDRLVFFEAPHGSIPAHKSIEEKRAAMRANRDVTVTTRDDLHVTRNGNVAWTTITLDIVTTGADGVESRSAEYQTAIWERRGVRWVIVNEHLSTLE
jgi:ketosteroid isomerase-like protein